MEIKKNLFLLSVAKLLTFNLIFSPFYIKNTMTNALTKSNCHKIRLVKNILIKI